MTSVTVSTAAGTAVVSSPSTTAVTGGAQGPPGPGWVSVTSRGAKGDDVTNDTVAIQDTLDYAAANGLRVWFPAGAYRVTRLTMNSGQVLEGPVGGGHGILLPNTKHARLTLLAGTNDHLIYGPAGVAHVQIRNLHLDGNKNNNLTAGSAIYLDNASPAEECQWTIEHCFIEAAREYGIYIGTGRRAVTIDRKTLVSYNGLSGIRVNGSDALIQGRCIVGSNGVDGIQVGAAVTRIVNCDIYGNTGTGITVLSTIQQVMILGNGIDRNGTHGIYCSSGSQAITIMGNDLHSNSQTTNGAAHHITVATTTGLVAIVGNVFGVDAGMTKAAGYCIYHDTGATSQQSANVAVAGSSNLGLTN